MVFVTHKPIHAFIYIYMRALGEKGSVPASLLHVSLYTYMHSLCLNGTPIGINCHIYSSHLINVIHKLSGCSPVVLLYSSMCSLPG